MFFEKFELFADAPNAVQKLRELVLQLAIQGRLVSQSDNDEPAAALMMKAIHARKKLVAARIVRDEGPGLGQVCEVDKELPAGWVRAPLSTYVAVIMGQSPPSSAYNQTGEGLPFYQGKAQFGRLYPAPADWCSEPTKIGELGDVVISVRAPVGPTNMLREKSCVGRGLAALRSLAGDPKHLLYTLRALEKSIAAMGFGSTFVAISKRDLDDVAIPVPPLAEQKRIVAKVDELMALCDALEQQQQERQTRHAALAHASLARFAEQPTPDNLNFLFHKSYDITADGLRQAILILAVGGMLVPQDDDDESAVSFIDRMPALPRPARYANRSRIPIQGIAALSVGPTERVVPRGWACVPLIEVARLESGHTPSRARADWWDGDVPWIGVVDARLHDGQVIYETRQHTNHEGLANSAARLLPTGTVCVSRTASVGYVVIMGRPMATSQDFVNWVPTEAVASDWLRLVFTAEKPAFERFSKGAVHQTIYYPEWLSMHVMVPPLAEQRRIVAKVDQLMALVDELERLEKQERASAAALMDALVAELTAPPRSTAPLQSPAASQPPSRPSRPIVHSARNRASVTTVAARRARRYHRKIGATLSEKSVFLVEAHVGIDCQSRWRPWDFGPYDPEGRTAAELEAANLRWFTVGPGAISAQTVTLGERSDEAEAHFRQIAGDRYAAAIALIDRMVEWDADTAELHATLYAVWNDALFEASSQMTLPGVEGRVTNELIAQRFFAWHESKRTRFTSRQVHLGIAAMRSMGLVPRGERRLIVQTS